MALETLSRAARLALGALARATEESAPRLEREEIGAALSVGDGVARVAGLGNVKTGEILLAGPSIRALAYDLDPEEIGAVLLDDDADVRAGARLRATGRVVSTPVGDDLIGRVIDPLGRPLDRGPELKPAAYYPVEREATPIIDRAPVSVPLQTGVKAIDAFVPVGRGQRELILGDRQTGKTAVALDTIVNQAGAGVVCVYAAIGQRTSAVARVVQSLKERGAMAYTVVVAAGSDDPPGLQYLAPYAATSVAEYFMEQGKDALIVYDDLTQHAYAYRELSLILRRPPGREAFPPDVFYAHARLLERATRRKESVGGGSLTALPIAETQARNISAYVPTNLISITDGQVYLDSELFQRNIRPAVDIGRSVSRVGGKSQLPAFRDVVANLKLAYSQFEELELFARLGTRLDEASERAIRRGREIREVMKQAPFETVPAAEQIGILVGVTGGVFGRLPLERIQDGVERVRLWLRRDAAELLTGFEAGKDLTEADRERILQVAQAAVRSMEGELSAAEGKADGD